MKRSLTATSLVSSLAILLMGVASVSIMWIGVRLTLAGTLTVGDFFAHTLCRVFLVAPILQMSSIASQITESLAGLDTESEMFIQRSRDHLVKGRTTFVIAHRLSTIRRADQILAVEDGRMVERGTHEELIAKRGRYYELYTYQARI